MGFYGSSTQIIHQMHHLRIKITDPIHFQKLIMTVSFHDRLTKTFNQSSFDTFPLKFRYDTKQLSQSHIYFLYMTIIQEFQYSRQIHLPIHMPDHLIHFRKHQEEADRNILIIPEIYQILINDRLQTFINRLHLCPGNPVYPMNFQIPGFIIYFQ